MDFCNRIKPLQGIQIPGAQTSRFNQKKYNIWSTSLQEEVMENLKGCGVDQDSGRYDRNCESYDYSLKYRLNGENSLKRRQSYSDDSDKGFNCSTSNTFESKNKRFRANSLSVKDRKNVRLRLGNRSDDSSSNDGASALNMSRCIVDLSVTADSSNDDVARDLANKLYEEKDDLMSKFSKFFVRLSGKRRKLIFYFSFYILNSSSCKYTWSRLANQIVQRNTKNRK